MSKALLKRVQDAFPHLSPGYMAKEDQHPAHISNPPNPLHPSSHLCEYTEEVSNKNIKIETRSTLLARMQ